MSKRVNKDGSLNYWEILKQQLEKMDLFLHSIMIIFLTVFVLECWSREENISDFIFKTTLILSIASIYYLIWIRTIFFVYKRDLYKKDLKKVKSKKSYKNLKNNMNKLSNSIFMPSN